MNKALRIVLAAALALSMAPAPAWADEEGAEYDRGTGLRANSWRFADGVLTDPTVDDEAPVPDAATGSEGGSDEGIAPFAAWEDVPADGKSVANTWTRANTKDNYTLRFNPTDKDRIVSVPGTLAVGIDVSEHNNDPGGRAAAPIDWNQVKADGITFAIIRIGYGSDYTSQDDDWFASNYEGARAAGLDVGVYLYSYAPKATGAAPSAQSEAQHVLRVLQENDIAPEDLAYPVYLDLEDDSQTKLKKGTLGDVATTFCNTVSAAGYAVGIYANQYWFDSVLKGDHAVFDPDTMAANGWSRWVARYSNGTSSSEVANTDIWQFTPIGKINGTPKTYCDVNFAYRKASATSAPSATYRVTYQLNGGANHASNAATYTGTLTLKSPTRAGYKFDGWYTDAKFTKKVTKLSGANATVYAKWSRPYAIKYVMNKGKNNKANPSKYGGTITLKNPTRSGYTFAGWYTNKKFTSKSRVTKLTNKKVTLYAKWKKNYKITYKLNGGKNNKANPSKYGGTLTLKNPTRAGYVFKGWYTNKKLTKKVTKLSMTKNRTVYAKWAKLKGGTYRVNTPGGLYVRATPSTTAAITGGLANGQTVRVVKIKGDWGQLSDGRGWIKLSYAKRV